MGQQAAAAGTGELRPVSGQQQRAWEERRLPQPERVAEGTWAMPIPIPNNPLVYTYCYVLAEDRGFSLIDTGWDSPEGYRALVDGLRSIGFDLRELNGVAITHYHRDHLGLAAAIAAELPDVWMAIHGHDLKTIKDFRDRKLSSVNGSAAEHDIVSEYGVPESRREEIDGRSTSRSRPEVKLSLPQNLLLLTDEAPLPLAGRKVVAKWTPGHTFGHTSFFEAQAQPASGSETGDAVGAFFSGDHVLPTITPNIGLDAGFITHSLKNYLHSLERMRALPEQALVLPSHGFRFFGLHTRVGQISAHHDERLSEVRQAAAELGRAGAAQPSVYDISARLHWSRGFENLEGFNLFAALAETAAHMHYLDLPVGSSAQAADAQAGASAPCAPR